MEEEPVTVAGLIRCGAFQVLTLNESFRDESLKEMNREFVAKVLESLHTPGAFEDFLYELFLEKGRGEATEIENMISEIKIMLADPGAGQKMLKKIFAEVFPKARPGRPSDFRAESDPPRFLKDSSELFSACEKLLRMQAQFPAKSMNAILDFLDSEDPEHVSVVRSNVTLVAEVTKKADFKAVKTLETQAQRLADAITGKLLFGWSYSYSKQCAQQFRRFSALKSES